VKIHPSAIVHPDCQIADDVEIGAFVCIEGPAVIGSGCVIQPHAILSGAVTLGKNNTVGYGAVIGSFPQDLSYKPGTQSGVEIGDNNVIREYTTINRGTAEGSITRVGNNCFLMTGTHIGHNSVVGNQVIIANNVLLGGHVHIGDRAFLGGSCVFHQFVRVGPMVVAQGNSAFSKDVPPFTLGAILNKVVGLNSIGLRRAGLTAAERQEAKEAFRLLYRSGYNTRQALDEAAKRQWGPIGTEFFSFVATAKKRGICDLLDRKASNSGTDSE